MQTAIRIILALSFIIFSEGNLFIQKSPFLMTCLSLAASLFLISIRQYNIARLINLMEPVLSIYLSITNPNWAYVVVSIVWFIFLIMIKPTLQEEHTIRSPQNAFDDGFSQVEAMLIVVLLGALALVGTKILNGFSWN